MWVVFDNQDEAILLYYIPQKVSHYPISSLPRYLEMTWGVLLLGIELERCASNIEVKANECDIPKTTASRMASDAGGRIGIAVK